MVQISNRESVNGVVSNLTAQAMDAFFQWTKCHCKGAAGFAAEDANALNDFLHGRRVRKVGLDNSLNGADRIVDGLKIQTKYFDSASKSVDAAFSNGQYRYGSMKLEVPADQYDQAVRLMEKKILQGQVPGVSDPTAAKQIVLRGKVTYAQAKRIAQAGNYDSVLFDVKAQSVTCLAACGLSFLMGYAEARRTGKTHIQAAQQAGKAAAKSGISALVVGVGVQQGLRTAAGRQFAAGVTYASRKAIDAAVKTQVGKAAVTKVASSIAGKQLSGAVAKNVMTKALRGNAITGAATLVATTIPDAIDLCRGKISRRQFGENVACNAAGVAGGTGGSLLLAGVGAAICPPVGITLGILGGIAGGIGASTATRKLCGLFHR